MNTTDKPIVELLQEDWVRFRRVYCLSGSIDIWTGDCIDNPNNEFKSHLALNATATYYRLDGMDQWIKNSGIRYRIGECLNNYCVTFSSQDIWDYATQRTFAIDNTSKYT